MDTFSAVTRIYQIEDLARNCDVLDEHGYSVDADTREEYARLHEVGGIAMSAYGKRLVLGKFIKKKLC